MLARTAGDITYPDDLGESLRLRKALLNGQIDQFAIDKSGLARRDLLIQFAGAYNAAMYQKLVEHRPNLDAGASASGGSGNH